MSSRASQVLNCLLEHPVITVESGFPLSLRSAWELKSEKDDLALSVEWHDSDGCLWAADFSEEALAVAEINGAMVSMIDCEGTKVVFHFYKPAERVELLLN